jgi:hypothetical protein
MTIALEQAALRHIKEWLQPLNGLGDDEGLASLCNTIGWDNQALGLTDPAQFNGVVNALTDAIQAFEIVLEKDKVELTDVAEAILPLASAVVQVLDIVNTLQPAAGSPQNTLKYFCEDLFNFLLEHYLLRHWPWPAIALEFLGIYKTLELTEIKRSDGMVMRSAGRFRKLDLNAISKLMQDPWECISAAYINNSAGTRRTVADITDILGPQLAERLVDLGLTASYGMVPKLQPPLPPDELAAAQHMLHVGWARQFDPSIRSALDVVLALLDDNNRLTLAVLAEGNINLSFPLANGTLQMTFQSTTAPILINSDSIQLADGSGGPAQFNATVQFATSDAAAPAVRLGSVDSTHFEIGEIKVALGVDVAAQGTDAGGSIDLKNMLLSIKGGDGDSFLNKILPSTPIDIKAGLGIDASLRKGIRFRGGAGFEVTIPLDLSIFDGLTIQSLYLAAQASEEKIQAVLAASASVKLGPISGCVERIGIIFKITFPKTGGTDVQIGFKPPKGLGLAVNASVVIGGGYLFFDPDNAKYAGVLQLEIAKKIAITAIGLLTTRMPDGSDGFSLLIIICAEFPPIQLGFGFVLKGLGGLLGINRTMMIEPLRAGVKNRTLNSILFPKDPIANAPKIISDLSTIYPPAPGRFVFGPMIMLGWGSPEPLLKIELGLVLEIPSPIRIAILGRISLALPDEKAAVVVVHLDILGAIDFDTCDASVDATLYDSRVALFVITGDMAMRVNWGPKSVFIASLGGFHPNFATPPNFPTLERLAISLATGDNPRLRLESYMAVTSNTVQFGARLDIYAAVNICILGTFSAQANMSLDAFLNLSPFWFQVDIEANAAIYHNDDVLIGVHLALSLAGPEPWHAWGDATFDFFGKHSISFDVTIAGEQPAPPPLPPADPLPELLAALGDARNWSAQLPAEGNMLVTLRSLPPGDGVLAHPFGVLTVRQKVLPLGVAIQKFGAANVAQPTAYAVADIQLGTKHIYAPGEVKGAFAPGQFFNLSADEKLSRPAFESFTAGHTGIGSQDIYYPAGKARTAVFNYENVVIDIKDKDKPHPKTSTRAATGNSGYTLHPAVAEALVDRGAAAQSPLQARGSRRFRGPKQPLGINEPGYVWVNKQTCKSAAGGKATTYTEARQTRPVDGKNAQLVGSHEVKP